MSALLYSREEAKQIAKKSALDIYLFYRSQKELSESESKEKTIEELMSKFFITKTIAETFVNQMWN